MTSTKVAIFLALVLVVGLLVLDKSGPPANCTWYYSHQVGGGMTGECVTAGHRPPFGASTTP